MLESKLFQSYRESVLPQLREEMQYANVMQVPTVKKITVNMGVGEATQNPRALEAAVEELTRICGQKPAITRAKKSIAAFKLREGMAIGAVCTLRRQRMWHFLERLITVSLPQVRDFRGLPRRGFDGHGNYTMGVREQIIFPEIGYDDIDKVRGMNISVHTSAPTDQEGMRLLELLGMPFRRN